MKLSELTIGTPFVYGGNIYYKWTPIVPFEEYRIIKVVRGNLDTFPYTLKGDVIVTPYERKTNI